MIINDDIADSPLNISIFVSIQLGISAYILNTLSWSNSKQDGTSISVYEIIIECFTKHQFTNRNGNYIIDFIIIATYQLRKIYSYVKSLSRFKFT